MTLKAPVLSLFDPPQEGEGSIDPLSLQPTYERLAERVYPFMTVRMSRPRFLTAIAVLAWICQDLQDEVAADDVTPAWLVGEWHVVEAFVRRRDNITGERRWGLPGVTKVGRALKAGRRLGKDAYLKTPKVFGFTGVYKTLALGLEIVSTDDILPDDGAYELLAIWEREQGLSGFLENREGPGARFRDDFKRAIETGLRKGYTDRGNGWEVWDTIVTHLDPSRTGASEATWICRRLSDASIQRHKPRDKEATRMRREVLSHLESAGRPVTDAAEEATFFRELLQPDSPASEDLRHRLAAIDAYESLCRPLEDGLRLILHLSTVSGSVPVSADDFAAHPLAVELAARTAPGAARVAEAFCENEWEEGTRDLVARYGDVREPRRLYHTLLEHHEEAQRSKPPDGKRPWVERAGSRGVIVRPQYRAGEALEGNDAYVRDYRTTTASEFLQDLRRLPR